MKKDFHEMPNFNQFIAGLWKMLSLFVLLNISLPLPSCSCVPPGSPKEELENSSVVFQGKVIKITDELFNSLQLHKVEFKVSMVWKGEITEDMSIRTFPGKGGDCGYVFKEGIEYLIYVYGPKPYIVSNCSRTKQLSQAEFDLKELGKGKPPLKAKRN
jgi:hypothetical protein